MSDVDLLLAQLEKYRELLVDAVVLMQYEDGTLADLREMWRTRALHALYPPTSTGVGYRR